MVQVQGWKTYTYLINGCLRTLRQRSYYRVVIDTCKEVLKETFTVNGQFQVPPISACLLPAAFDIIMHFSIDMAQQVCCSLTVHSTIKINAHVVI